MTISKCFIPQMNMVAMHNFSLATAKISIFLQNMLWKTCRKLNFEQLFHSMSVANMNIYARIQGKMISLATACSKQTSNIFTRHAIGKL